MAGLYQAYRPRTFDEVVGNKEAIRTLESFIKRDISEVPHAFLFSGPSGCGKTTLARILAKKLGCSDANFVEIDSADFRGIDTIREIRRQMRLAPVGGGSCRVWLIDECHKLTGDAQSALPPQGLRRYPFPCLFPSCHNRSREVDQNCTQ